MFDHSVLGFCLYFDVKMWVFLGLIIVFLCSVCILIEKCGCLSVLKKKKKKLIW